MTRRTPLVLASIAAVLVPGAAAQAGAPKEDWPRIDGQLWINTHDRDATHHGGERNDELLGGHGDDTIFGNGGHDVIWGDHKARGNTTRQRDRIDAGRDADWVYASHGYNSVYGGPGRDTIRVWFGRGFVDCGPGRDILSMSHRSDPKVKRRGCERISHKSARRVSQEG